MPLVRRIGSACLLALWAPLGALVVLLCAVFLTLGFGLAVVIESFSGSKFPRRGRL